MPTTVTTNNPNGIGFQTGQFTLPTGTNVSEAFAGRISSNKIYRSAWNCNIVEDCGMMSWIEEYGGVEFDCHKNYSLLEYNGTRYQIKVAEDTTIPTTSTTGTIAIGANDHYVSGLYFLPQVGNTLIAPNGALIDITAVTHNAANDTDLTVRQRGAGAAIALTANTLLLVVPGRQISDCVCPSGQFRIPDLPIEHDLSMVTFADKGVLCGSDLEECKNFVIPFLDEAGNEISEKEAWFTPSQKAMYQGIEQRKNYERLLNPIFGLIPTIKARGIKFTQADANELTIADIRFLKKSLAVNGVSNREFAIFAGTDKFSQWQQFLGVQGVSQLNYMERPLNDCSWINMQYCGIMVEGLTLHVYEDCTFGNGKGLGAAGFVFPNSSIWVPMGNRPLDSKYSFGTPNRNGTMAGKKFTTVYFQSIQGVRYDMVFDSNGILGPRNSMGTGCRTHEWSAQTEFTFEVHCANEFVYDGL
ncbi:MAG TPA: hypothetical protein VJ279_05850 [Hanamia sp.]|nr:hypothetical protein [Hanamia sp.]